MTYHCQLMPFGQNESFKRISHLDRQSCGLASTLGQATPTMDITQQRVVMPFFQTYDRVRKDTIKRLENKNPMDILKAPLTFDSDQCNSVVIVSESKAQILEDLATKSLNEPQGTVTKVMANFWKVVNFVLGLPMSHLLVSLWLTQATPPCSGILTSNSSNTKATPGGFLDGTWGLSILGWYRGVHVFLTQAGTQNQKKNLFVRA